MADTSKKNNLIKFKKTGLLFFVIFILTMSITIQVKTVGNSTRAGITPQENKLRDTLLKEQEKYEKLKDIEKEREETLAQLREDATRNDQKAKATMEELNKINKKLGLIEVSGPGVVITISDASIKKENSMIEYSQLIVHDMDILQIINILRNAGAEAIAVNGQRVVGDTGISCIGVVIKVNEEKIGSPYIISAIGNQNNLESAMNMAGGIKDVLKSYGINIEVDRKSNIQLPKYSGTYKNNYILID